MLSCDVIVWCHCVIRVCSECIVMLWILLLFLCLPFNAAYVSLINTFDRWTWDLISLNDAVPRSCYDGIKVAAGWDDASVHSAQLQNCSCFCASFCANVRWDFWWQLQNGSGLMLSWYELCRSYWLSCCCLGSPFTAQLFTSCFTTYILQASKHLCGGSSSSSNSSNSSSSSLSVNSFRWFGVILQLAEPSYVQSASHLCHLLLEATPRLFWPTC